MNPSRISLAALGCAAFFIACGESAAPTAGPAPVKKAETAVAAPDAGVTLAEAYVYTFSPTGKRDPFRSPMVDQGGRPEGPTGVCTEVLCQFDLDQLRLVAVVTGDANPLAMVEDPQGRGHLVRKGVKMGKQGGEVTQILRDSVTVTEGLVTPDGKKSKVNHPLHLKQDTATTPELNLMNGKVE